MNRLLIVGCGDIAKRALPRLVREYDRVFGLAHTAAQAEDIGALGAMPLLGDLAPTASASPCTKACGCHGLTR